MSALFVNMLPVLTACLAGWVIGKRQQLEIRTLGIIVIYAIAPVVNFDAVLKAPMTVTTLALPLATFIIGGCNSLLSYALARRLLVDREHRLFVASAASSANTLYYGLGLALAVLPVDMVPLFCVAAIGLSISESIFGYAFLARNNFTLRAALIRVARLPVLAAVVFALLLKLLMPVDGLIALLAPLAASCRGALILLGSMILGAAIGTMRGMQFNPRLTALVLFTRHALFALLAAGLLILDAHTAQLIARPDRIIFQLFALMPIANNSLTFAVTLGLPTTAICSTIIVSNLLAILLAAAACWP